MKILLADYFLSSSSQIMKKATTIILFYSLINKFNKKTNNFLFSKQNTTLHPIMTNPKYNHWYLIGSTVAASLNFFFWGYSFSVFNSLRELIQKEVFPEADSDLITLIITAPFLTAIPGSFIAGPLATKVGRRKMLIISNIVGIIAVLITLISSLFVIILGRLLLGFTLGLASVIVNLYIIETVPLEHRGRCFGFANILKTLGTLFGYIEGLQVPNTISPDSTSQVWRVLLGVSFIPPLISALALLIFFRHETPNYWVSKDELEKATTSIRQVFKTHFIERLDEIIKEKEYVASQGKIKYKDLFKEKYRLALIVAIMLLTIRELAPFDLLSVNFQDLISLGSKNPSKDFPKIMSVVFGCVLLISDIARNIFASKLNVKVGVVFGILGFGICDLLFGILGLTLGSENLLSKIFLLIWPVFYVLSVSSFAFLNAAEALPPKAVSLATTANLLFGFLTVQIYPHLRDSVGEHQVFIGLGCIAFLSIPFFWKNLVNPEGKNKDEILKAYVKDDNEERTKLLSSS